MKIGIFDPYLDTLGGGEKYTLSVASCLSKINNVSVFWDHPEILSKASQRFNLDLSKVTVKRNIFSSHVSFLSRFFSARDYDLIFYLSDGSVPIVLSKLFVHFQFPVEWVKNGFGNNLKLKRAGKIICNSQFTKKYIDNKFGLKSIVLYPPVDPFPEKNVQKENIILTVGRYGVLPGGKSFKKHEFLIKVFKKMIDHGLKEWKLVIVTSYKEKDRKKIEEMKKSVKGYNIEIKENADWKTIIDVNKRARIYWHAAGFGENLVDHPELAEHFGITTVETMMSGAVPVVFGGGGQLEIVENEKNGFTWTTEKELVSKTLKLINQPEIYKKMALSAKERAKLYTGDRFCREVNRIFNE